MRFSFPRSCFCGRFWRSYAAQVRVRKRRRRGVGFAMPFADRASRMQIREPCGALSLLSSECHMRLCPYAHAHARFVNCVHVCVPYFRRFRVRVRGGADI